MRSSTITFEESTSHGNPVEVDQTIADLQGYAENHEVEQHVTPDGALHLWSYADDDVVWIVSRGDGGEDEGDGYYIRCDHECYDDYIEDAGSAITECHDIIDRLGSKYADMRDLTGQESGLILFTSDQYGNDVDEAIVGNWNGVTGVPRVSPLGTGLLGLGETLTVISEEHVDDITVESWWTVIYDENHDLPFTSPTPATIYHVTGQGRERLTVYAPDDWA